MTTFLELLEKMKLAVEAGDLSTPPSSGVLREVCPCSSLLGGDVGVKDARRFGLDRLCGGMSLEDMAAVFMRMAS